MHELPGHYPDSYPKQLLDEPAGFAMPPGPTSTVVNQEVAAIMKRKASDFGLQVRVREENQKTMAGPEHKHQGKVTVLIEGGDDSLVDVFVSMVLRQFTIDNGSKKDIG